MKKVFKKRILVHNITIQIWILLYKPGNKVQSEYQAFEMHK